MVYVCELNPGHHIYLDNQGNQTIVTTTLGMPGQQQQASNSMTTGPWTAPPEAYQTADGAVLKLFTAQGEICIYIQNNNVSLMGEVPSMAGAQRLSVQQTTTVPTATMPPMQPMQPMQPMTMGNMQMTMNPMEMRMGNMELKMESTGQTPQPAATRQFCSQCGNKVAPEDRFCSSCGHALS
ncbi:zinc ribbon domain-containing protein [Leptothoe spongobia]|uniref:Zinc ribbon domain-containing protein n=1 Tax=Leptothoe spongobia TAU-MAC 1115 TaxID=1967444 RepID=A0A947DC72_9CYAN|nr:zinc ribbon domain-containing protein [Leptothoe spongobia]MBT9314465.1 zinc ribbon domain-containing protein [Leptothoe spongobia TAU-MAC 1115]